MNPSLRWLWAGLTAATLLLQPAISRADACDSMAASAQGKALLGPAASEMDGATSHVFRNVEGISLRLFVFAPTTSPTRRTARRPAVILFYGGGWLFGHPDQFAPQAGYLAKRGAVAILPDYRAYCRAHTPVTGQMDDAAAAVIWVRSHAAELDVDPKRIAVSGGSSGGHLAVSTAVFAQSATTAGGATISSKPNLLVLFYPCLDLTSEFEKSSADAFGGHGKDVSPLYHIGAGLPPTVIFQGTKDPLYPEAKAYCAEARRRGDACRFVEVRDAQHGFFVRPGPAYDFGLAGMDEVLTKSGYLPPSKG